MAGAKNRGYIESCIVAARVDFHEANTSQLERVIDDTTVVGSRLLLSLEESHSAACNHDAADNIRIGKHEEKSWRSENNTSERSLRIYD